MQAVETYFRGVRYRSRTEARWAVFFTVLGIEFEYEPTKVQLNGCRYIPDFKLTIPSGYERDTRFFLEIKGDTPTNDELAKVTIAAHQERVYVSYLISGTPNKHQAYAPFFMPSNGGSVTVHAASWVQCPLCGRLGMAAAGDNDRFLLSHGCTEEIRLALQFNMLTHWTEFYENLSHPSSTPMLDVATQAATCARFESPDNDALIGLYAEVMATMRRARCFGSYDTIHRFLSAAHNYSLDPKPPGFEGFIPYYAVDHISPERLAKYEAPADNVQ